MEEGRNAGAKLHYVAKVLSVSEKSGEISVCNLRMSEKYGVSDTFYFPIIEDAGDVSRLINCIFISCQCAFVPI